MGELMAGGDENVTLRFWPRAFASPLGVVAKTMKIGYVAYVQRLAVC